MNAVALPSPLEEQVQAVVNNEVRGWRAIAVMLETVESAGPEFPSFSSWLNSVADKMELPAAVLERYHFVGRYWRRLSEQHPLPKEAPGCGIPGHVRIEHLEILAELEPLMTQEAFSESVAEVLSARARLSEMRALLQILRPLSCGDHAAGAQIARANALAGFKDFP